MPKISTGVETHFYCRIRPYLENLSELRRGPVDFDDLKTAVTQIMFHGNADKLDWNKLRKYWTGNDWTSIFKILLAETCLPCHKPPNIWIEKTPDHLLQIRQIHEEFQNSKFIILYRDPRRIGDIVNSCV